MAAERVQFQPPSHPSYLSQFMTPSNANESPPVEEKDPFAQTAKMKIQEAKKQRKHWWI